MKTIQIRNKNNEGEKISVTVDVVESGDVLFSKVVEARSKDELDRTIANVLQIANQVSEDFDSVAEGEWTAPVVVEEVVKEVVKSADEVAQELWLAQWAVYEKANNAMKALTEAGIESTPAEITRFNALKTWVGDNRKPEYAQYM